ncbi:O-antigen ligase [uncultured Tateyamaria sp.]|uniref:O-antigen ligase family protein n=1 Tax=uncultured Tateyamaria sp. TaxID=455651 RepID=UPI002606E483|nr:O-antigen ligase family protein [uncultured Tateyamaria sp.]
MIPPVFALLSWPVVVSLICRGRSLQVAILVTILGGYLFLPERHAIDLPALYELNKISIPAYTALALALIAISRASNTGRGGPQTSDPSTAQWLDGWVPRLRLPLVLIGLTMVGAVMTVVTNRDPVIELNIYNWPRGIVGENIFIPGLRLQDAGASILVVMVNLIPLLLARRFFAHPEGQKILLAGFCIGGLLYVPLAMFEARMSPQLNQWTYGFFAHLWSQHVRGDGFRPIVFLSHGLLVALFLSTALIISVGLARVHTGRLRGRFLMAAGMLFIGLVITKSLGALVIALFLCPILLFAPRWVLLSLTAGIVSIALLYPVVRGTSIIPLDTVVTLAGNVNEERAASFAYRLNFEEQLLARAQERPFFGWGSWGRNLYLGNGEFAVPDGEWTLLLSQSGWFGFIGRFGLMFLPVILLLWRWRKDGIGMETAVIAAALTAAAIDLIPNSGMTPDKWLLAGALWGRLELGRITATANEEVPDPPALRLRPGYARPAPAAVARDTTEPTAPAGPRYTRQAKRITRGTTAPTTKLYRR